MGILEIMKNKSRKMSQKRQYPKIKGNGIEKHVGINNYFPVSLLDRSVREKFDYFSTNGLKSNNLSIKLEFTEALTKQWYMMIISEYLVAITFDPKTGNPSFKIV